MSSKNKKLNSKKTSKKNLFFLLRAMSCEPTSCIIFLSLQKRFFIYEEIHINNIIVVIFADKT